MRSTLLLGGSSLVTLLVGLLATKCWAILLGPKGFGYLGLVQNLLLLAGLVAGCGVSTALVRFGAEAAAQNDLVRVAALRQASWWLTGLLAGVVGALMWIFGGPISTLLLGANRDRGVVGWIGLALLFNLAGAIFTSLLNAHHRVGALARLNVLSKGVAAGVAVLVIFLWREQGIVAAVVGGAIAAWGCAWRVCSREIRPETDAVRPRQVITAARDLLRFGVPCTASLLVGTGVQLLVPVIVLNLMGQESVGLYRAVATVSTAYLGLLLTTMTQDYYPRLSAVSRHLPALIDLVNEQHELILLLAIPLVVVLLAAAPFLIPLIYSRQFRPVVSVLEWQLMGDILKFSSWTLAFVLLARDRSRAYFLAEAVVGITTVVSTWLGVRWFGLDGLGMAYLAQYALYFAVVWLLVRREIDLPLTRVNRRLLVTGLAAAGLVRLTSLAGWRQGRAPIAWLLAVVVTVGSARILRKKYGGLRWLKERST
ncbi:MAG: oligosaccharide flippase family protein [Verrucomicrobia bacterium]|nr:oligosaccharide flippase family protein [Verrucomicrobiota bacterium]